MRVGGKKRSKTIGGVISHLALFQVTSCCGCKTVCWELILLARVRVHEHW